MNSSSQSSYDDDEKLDNKADVFQTIASLQNKSSTLEIACGSLNGKTEDTKIFPPDTTSTSSPCILPTSSFTGDYNFDIYFEPQKMESKKVGWTYSEERDKLYVAKDLACPINFVTGKSPPPHSKIRVTAVFAQPDHASEVVRRCINHSFIDLNHGVFHPDHLIRCECDQAEYETDGITDRRSVILPYEHPPDGQDYSTYIFKFVCYGSCAGGLNRRPIRVIFTLEVNNDIVGRRALDVKICACPWRDSKHEDKITSNIADVASGSTKNLLPKKRKKEDEENPDFLEVLQFVNKITGSAVKKPKPSKTGIYTITVHDEEEYEFLIQAKKLYELHQTMLSLSPELLHYLKSVQKKKKELENK